jgi:hypothetical protein
MSGFQFFMRDRGSIRSIKFGVRLVFQRAPFGRLDSAVLCPGTTFRRPDEQAACEGPHRNRRLEDGCFIRRCESIRFFQTITSLAPQLRFPGPHSGDAEFDG